METVKHISEAIRASKALVGTTPSTTTAQRRPASSWLKKWLRLQTSHHPRLQELEAAVGQFCADIWADSFEDGKRGRLLVLIGENGTGKTHCAKAVRAWIAAAGRGKQFVRRANHIESLTCVFWSWPKLLDTLKEGGWSVIDDMMEAPLLIIDELGGGHDPSRVGVDKLCQVLSRREGMWTLITTNILPAAWEETFDRRVASRFFRSASHVDLTDVPDFGTIAASEFQI